MWKKGTKMLSEARHSKKIALFISVTGIGAIFFLEVFASWALMVRMRLQKSEDFTKSEPTFFLCSIFRTGRDSSLASLIDDRLNRPLNTR